MIHINSEPNTIPVVYSQEEFTEDNIQTRFSNGMHVYLDTHENTVHFSTGEDTGIFTHLNPWETISDFTLSDSREFAYYSVIHNQGYFIKMVLINEDGMQFDFVPGHPIDLITNISFIQDGLVIDYGSINVIEIIILNGDTNYNGHSIVKAWET